MLRNVLAAYTGEDPKRLQFSYSTSGKPALAGGIEFNLSHSCGKAVIAVAHCPVGVDVEVVGSSFAWKNVAAHFFSTAERNRLATVPEVRRAETFLRCWTRREAYVKARGCGDPSEAGGLTSSVIDEQGRAWSITNVVPFRGFVGAIACEGDHPEIEVFNWSATLSRVNKFFKHCPAEETNSRRAVSRMEPFAIKVLIGFVVGSLVGMTGVGGGVLMLPLLIFVLNVPAIIAVGSDAAVNAITKLGAGFLHWRNGNVNWTLVLGLAAGSIPGACLGVGLLAYIRSLHGAGVNEFIKVAVGTLLILVPLLFVLQGELQLGIHRRASAYLLCSLPDLSWLNERRQAPTAARKSVAGMALIGFVAGFLVGATSVGSGSIIMGLLLMFYRLAPSKMVGSDIVHGLLLTGVTTVLHLGMGNVDVQLVAPLLVGSIPGALLGTRAANAMPAPWLRRLLCAILFATGLKMVWI